MGRKEAVRSPPQALPFERLSRASRIVSRNVSGAIYAAQTKYEIRHRSDSDCIIFWEYGPLRVGQEAVMRRWQGNLLRENTSTFTRLFFCPKFASTK